MGFLNALGLMTRAEHDKLVLKIEGERDKFRAQVRDACARAEKADALLKSADSRVSAVTRARDEMKRDLVDANDKFKKAVTDLAAAREEIDRLKPDAQKWRDRADRDRNRVRPSRAKKVDAPAPSKAKAVAKKAAAGK